jgi:MurNAc alpha-1-phosphate uridylyltransferase
VRQAVVLCGGLGTRMHHVSGPLPKVMLEVRGVAFLHRLIARIAAASFDEIVLCVGVGAEHVRRAVADRPPPVPVRFSEDGERLLGTAGALRQALDLLAPEFLVTYGDSYLTFDYAAPLQALEGAADADACLAVYQNKDHLEPSNVAVRDGRVVRYDKRRTLEEPRLDHIDYGAMALRRHVVEALPPGVPYGLDVVQAELARGGRLLAHPTPERFYEIGSPVGLADLERFLDSSPQPLPARPREGADPLSTLPSSGSPEPTDPRAAELSDLSTALVRDLGLHRPRGDEPRLARPPRAAGRPGHREDGRVRVRERRQGRGARALRGEAHGAHPQPAGGPRARRRPARAPALPGGGVRRRASTSRSSIAGVAGRSASGCRCGSCAT